tara:strand:+ start:96 stop:308 length:213 start_codon:yes stop_codon:yes gene_type:complete
MNEKVYVSMRKLTFAITEDNKTIGLEVITDRTPEWTISQYCRHRPNIFMALIKNEESEEQKAISREINLG